MGRGCEARFAAPTKLSLSLLRPSFQCCSPNLVEGKFCEFHVDGILRSSHNRLPRKSAPWGRVAGTRPAVGSYPRARSYVAITTPVRVVVLSRRPSDACTLPANNRRPLPSTRGAIISMYSSITSATISEPISSPLPMITRFAPELSLSSATAAPTSPCSRVEFGQSRLVAGLLEVTNLGVLLSASLNGPPWAFQEASSPSKVRS